MRSIREEWISKTVTELFDLKEYTLRTSNDDGAADVIGKSFRLHELQADAIRTYKMGYLSLREYEKIIREISDIGLCFADRLAKICGQEKK